MPAGPRKRTGLSKDESVHVIPPLIARALREAGRPIFALEVRMRVNKMSAGKALLPTVPEITHHLERLVTGGHVVRSDRAGSRRRYSLAPASLHAPDAVFLEFTPPGAPKTEDPTSPPPADKPDNPNILDPILTMIPRFVSGESNVPDFLDYLAPLREGHSALEFVEGIGKSKDIVDKMLKLLHGAGVLIKETVEAPSERPVHLYRLDATRLPGPDALDVVLSGIEHLGTISWQPEALSWRWETVYHGDFGYEAHWMDAVFALRERHVLPDDAVLTVHRRDAPTA